MENLLAIWRGVAGGGATDLAASEQHRKAARQRQKRAK
jgi:hypothetical protein